MSCLAIYREDAFVADHVLMRASVGLGRHPDNDIVLNDRTLSRFHARLERRGAEYVVIDLGAQNGVYLNGQKITGEHALTAGDRIGMGCYVAIFDPQAQAASRRRSDASSSAPVALPTHALTPLQIDENAQSELVDLDLDVDLDFSDEAPAFDANATQVEAKLEAKVQKKPILVLMFNGEEQSRHEIDSVPLVIGRSKTCDVVISLLGLSRRHTSVKMNDGQVHIQDLQSQNGTWVNNQRIDGERSLRHGDLINYYEYGVLFLENSDVAVNDAGVSLDKSARARGVDDMQAAAVKNALPAEKKRAESAREVRTVMNISALPDSEVAPSLVDKDSAADEEDYDLFDGFDLDDDKNYLREEENSLADLLDEHDLEDDEDDFKPSATEVLQMVLDRESSLLDEESAQEDEQADLAELEAFATGDPTRAQHSLQLDDSTALGDKTSAVFVPSHLRRGTWPSEDEFTEALLKSVDKYLWKLAVFLDEKPYTQMVVSQQAVRVGTDARCELALPKKAGLAGWQLTLIDFGKSLLCVRASEDARVMVDDVPVDQAVLKANDVVQMGRVSIRIIAG